MAKLGTFVAGKVLTAAELNAMGGAWTTYTPTWTGITTGNGTNSGGYVQFGRTTVWRASFVLGTTSAVTGAVSVTLPPFALASSKYVAGISVWYEDAGTEIIPGRILYNSTTVVNVEALNSAGTYLKGAALSSTVPMTWTTSDGIFVGGTYEAAS